MQREHLLTTADFDQKTGVQDVNICRIMDGGRSNEGKSANYRIQHGKNDGGNFKTQGPPIHVYITNQAPVSPIAAIQGDGTPGANVITVDTSANHNLKTGFKVNIVDAGLYDKLDAVVTVVTPTQFTYVDPAHDSTDVVGSGHAAEFAYDNLIGDNSKTDAAIQDEVYERAVNAGLLGAGTPRDYSF